MKQKSIFIFFVSLSLLAGTNCLAGKSMVVVPLKNVNSGIVTTRPEIRPFQCDEDLLCVYQTNEELIIVSNVECVEIEILACDEENVVDLMSMSLSVGDEIKLEYEDLPPNSLYLVILAISSSVD